MLPARRRGPTATPSRTPAPARRPSSPEIPAYEHPIAPLLPESQHALTTLPIRHDVAGLQARLNEAHARLGAACADLHELGAQRRRAAQAQAARRPDAPRDEELEKYRRDLFQKIGDLTGEMEGEVRRVADRQAKAEWGVDVLRELSLNASGGGGGRGRGGGGSGGGGGELGAGTQGTVGSTQMTMGDGEGEGEDTEMKEEEGEAGENVQSTLAAMRAKLEGAEQQYQALSMRERYSEHNHYVNFRRLLHSAQYPEDEAAPPMAHASTWFDATTGTPQHLGSFVSPTEGAAVVGAGDGNVKSDPASINTTNTTSHPSLPLPPPPPPSQPTHESDSDIEAVAERTSIRCPLTLQPMRDPVSSRKCPHAFERSAILEMLEQQSAALQPRSRRGQAAMLAPATAVKCPVCEVMLVLADLQRDPILQRKIARIQAAEARRRGGRVSGIAGARSGVLYGDEEEDEEDDDDVDEAGGHGHGRGGRAEPITSSSPVQTPKSARVARMKRERLSGVAR